MSHRAEPQGTVAWQSLASGLHTIETTLFCGVISWLILTPGEFVVFIVSKVVLTSLP